ncbi:hypothetical protein [Modestobacter sp. SYSU DS0875]
MWSPSRWSTPRGRLVGLFTVHDAMRALEESEDLARTGGSEPLDRPYLATGVVGLARTRVAWLLVLVAAAALTVDVLDHVEDVLDQVVALALLVPLIGTGGNTGTLLGALLAAVGFGPAAWLVGADIAVVLCAALVVVCTLATTAGALTPTLAKRLAVARRWSARRSSPTFVDATGAIVSFLVAHFLVAPAVLGP